MGIQIEFNPDLALRKFGTPKLHPSECLPPRHELLEGMTHSFRKKGQRTYGLEGVVPLLTTEGNQKLSRPLAAVIIKDYTSYKEADGEIWTTGHYKVIKLFNPRDKKPHFNGLEYIPKRGK